MTSEDETPIFKRHFTKIRFDKKIANNGGKEFYLPPSSTRAQTTSLCCPLGSIICKGKADVQPEGAAANNQEQTTTKQLATPKFHANNLHMKLGHPGEDRMRGTMKNLHYIVNGALEVCEYCATANRNHKLLRKVL